MCTVYFLFNSWHTTPYSSTKCCIKCSHAIICCNVTNKLVYFGMHAFCLAFLCDLQIQIHQKLCNKNKQSCTNQWVQPAINHIMHDKCSNMLHWHPQSCDLWYVYTLFRFYFVVCTYKYNNFGKMQIAGTKNGSTSNKTHNAQQMQQTNAASTKLLIVVCMHYVIFLIYKQLIQTHQTKNQWWRTACTTNGSTCNRMPQTQQVQRHVAFTSTSLFISLYIICV